MAAPSSAADVIDQVVASVQRHRAGIADMCVQQLQRAGSRLAWDSVMLDQLRAQIERILDETVATLRSGPHDDAALQPDPASIEIGAHRARHGVHPAESLRAARVLFETAVSAVAGDLQNTGQPAESVTRFCLALHGSISRRVILAARAYFSSWLDQVHNSHYEQRLRVLRELSDASRGQLVGAVGTLLGSGQRARAAPAREGRDNAREQRSAPDQPLPTRREREVLQMAAQAMSNRQIAGALHIAEGTVRQHLSGAYRKLGATGRLDAVNRAVAHGLIRPATAPADWWPGG